MVALVLLWPVWLHPTTRYVGVHLDPPYYLWLGWRFGQAFRAGQLLPTHLTGAVHPFGIDTALLDGLAPSWIGGLFNLVTGPILAYNLTLLSGIGANLLAARSLGRTLSSRRLVWTTTAVAFAAAPVVAGRLALHLPFAWAFTLPLLLAEGLVVARGDRSFRPLKVALLLVVAYLCSAYFLIFGFALLVAPVVVAVVAAMVSTRHARRRDRSPHRADGGPVGSAPPGTARLGRDLLVAVVLTAVALSPFVAARLRYDADERAAGGAAQLTDDAVTYASDALGPITPPTQLTIPEPFPDVDRGSPLSLWAPTFAGALLLGGLSTALLLRFRLRTPLLVTFGGLWLLSLGPSLRWNGHVLVTGAAGRPLDWLPYRALLGIPGLGGLRAPDRVALAGAAVLAAGLAVGLDWLHRRLEGARHPRRPAAVLVTILAVGLALDLMVPMPTLDLGVSPAIRAALEQVRERGQGPDDAVLMVPADCDRIDPDIIALQILHHRPSLGCSTSAASIRWRSQLDPWARSAALASLRCDQSIISRRPTEFHGEARLDDAGVQSLREDLGVRFVIIDEGAAALCPDVAASLPALRRHEVIGTDGRYTVIDLDRPAAPA